MGIEVELLQIFIFFLSALSLVILWLESKSLFKRYVLIFLGIFLFEFSTQVLWINNNLYEFTYLGPNLNWIITLGWTNIVFFSMLITDYFCKKNKSTRFFIDLALITFISVFAESLVLRMGIRSYGPEAISLLSGSNIPLLSTPIEALYYIPVFIALVLGFVGYFENPKNDARENSKPENNKKSIVCGRKKK